MTVFGWRRGGRVVRVLRPSLPPHWARRKLTVPAMEQVPSRLWTCGVEDGWCPGVVRACQGLVRVLVEAWACAMETRTTGQLRAEGMTANDLRRSVRTGQLVKVRRGAYAAGLADDPRQEHRRLIGATIPGMGDVVLSHHSAAVVHGLELPGRLPRRVQVVRARRTKGGGQRNGVVQTRVTRLPPQDVVTVDGQAVTSRARTVVDLARGMGFDAAVVLFDAALRDPVRPGQECAAERDAPVEVVERCRRVPGITTARAALAFADGRAESALESRSRLMMWRYGIPEPVLQYVVLDEHGHVLARLDFAWPELMVYGECDGQVKYGVLLQEGQIPSGAVMQEKRRANDLAALGWREVRWDDAAVNHPVSLTRRLRRALGDPVPVADWGPAGASPDGTSLAG